MRLRRAHSTGQLGGHPPLVLLCTHKCHPQIPPVWSLPSLPSASKQETWCSCPGELDTSGSGSRAPGVLHPLRQGCGVGWGPGTPASLGILPYFSASWQLLPFPACSCTPALSNKAPLLLLPSHLQPLCPQERLSKSKAVPRQSSHRSVLPLQKESWIPTSHCSTHAGSGERSESHPCPTAQGPTCGRDGQALPWEGFFPTGCGTSLPRAA